MFVKKTFSLVGNEWLLIENSFEVITSHTLWQFIFTIIFICKSIYSISSKWVRIVKKNTTLSTDSLFIIARSTNTSSTIHGCWICTTLSCGLSLQTDIALLSPAKIYLHVRNNIIQIIKFQNFLSWNFFKSMKKLW